MTLNELPVGKAAVITKVGGAGALRCRLLDMGLIPKTKIVITKRWSPSAKPPRWEIPSSCVCVAIL